MTLIAVLKPFYHFALRIILKLCGLDFSWYENFYTSWPHALPTVEVCIQKLRSRKRSLRFFAGYDIERFAGAGNTVLDIGANIGAVSTHLLSLGYNVHAYEPDSRCVEFLRRRFSEIDKRRFHLHHEAIADYNGVTTLHYGTRTTESNTILESRPGSEISGGEQVEVRAIGDVLNAVGHASLIMMDIEGAEYDVLEEMLRPEYKDKFGLCVVESHAHKIPALESNHQRVVDLIGRRGLQDRVLLTWD
jgi:FkbM family methyltransferase